MKAKAASSKFLFELSKDLELLVQNHFLIVHLDWRTSVFRKEHLITHLKATIATKDHELTAFVQAR